jgi:hypothetical protein
MLDGTRRAQELRHAFSEQADQSGLHKLVPVRHVQANDALAAQAILNFDASLVRCAFSLTKMISPHSTRSGVTGVSASGGRPAEATFRAPTASYALG